ncbi:hypothetical protein OIU85_028283 [Salix viminalis]|uniref:Amidase domain-containing protein n=1 Tax=Salix viminalis TaxID=40686 RepID=A0A9Q0QKJ4_SALVM|nr:hypothetical protein OIU85_028283 [Salix viminalis]
MKNLKNPARSLLYLSPSTDFSTSAFFVLEVNPDALEQAGKADEERERNKGKLFLGDLHGIPVLLKDSIGTRDKLNTTCGSYALVGSEVARDAHVVEKLRNAGAVILGKASLSEWYQCRSFDIPDGWCARGGLAKNPYVKSGNPCGSSSGSAISVAANMVAVSLGTETDGSIICPADHNSVVGLKPTVGLTSRAGVIPISPRQDTIGPICRTVSDAVYVLDAIFLRKDGLKGKRVGVVRNPFFDSFNDSTVISTFNHHLKVLRQGGASIVDNLQIDNIDVILDPYQSGEVMVMLAEFKLTIKQYLEELIKSPVRSLADIIAFNNNNPDLESMSKYGQELLIAAEMTNGVGEEEKKAVELMEQLSEEGFEKMMKENDLDAMLTLGVDVSTVLAIGGYPAVTVPAGYDSKGKPFGICFGGLKGNGTKADRGCLCF